MMLKMDNIERLLNLIASDWKTFFIIILLLIFGLPEAWKKIDEIKKIFGIVTKQERRFLALEKKQVELIAENQRLKTEISEAEKRCKKAISETEKKFDDREHKHWGESLEIRAGYDNKMSVFEIKLDKIIEQLDKKESLDFKKLRNQIVQLGEDAIERKSISIRKLKSLEELYSEYTDKYDGNSYVATLIRKVRDIPVIGKLNEHGEDIEE